MPTLFNDERSRRIDPQMLETCHRDHLERYNFALQFAAGRRVLDIGCAFGYGSARLAAIAAEVKAIDLYDEALAAAKQSYQLSNLHFAKMDGCALAFPDQSFDMVVSFEVVEHVDEPQQFLAGIRRVLRPGGIAVLSTPNALVSAADGVLSDPTHLREYTPQQFRSELLGAGFNNVELQGQRLSEGVWKVHAMRAQMAWLDVLGLRRLLSGSFKSQVLAALVRLRFARPIDQVAEAKITSELDDAFVQLAICRV